MGLGTSDGWRRNARVTGGSPGICSTHRVHYSRRRYSRRLRNGSIVKIVQSTIPHSTKPAMTSSVLQYRCSRCGEASGRPRWPTVGGSISAGDSPQWHSNRLEAIGLSLRRHRYNFRVRDAWSLPRFPNTAHSNNGRSAISTDAHCIRSRYRGQSPGPPNFRPAPGCHQHRCRRGRHEVGKRTSQ